MTSYAPAESLRKLLRTYGAAILIAVVVAFFIRNFIVEAYRIPSPVMKPTLEPGDVVFVEKWSYRSKKAKKPKYGEVIVYSLPERPGFDFIRRIVGLPGDTITIRQGRLILNGRQVATAPSKDAVCGVERTPAGAQEKAYSVCWEPPLIEDYGPIKVPEGAVFALGDMRTREGKIWGVVPLEAIKGRGLLTWLSVEPEGLGVRSNVFSRIRFERMFKPIR